MKSGSHVLGAVIDGLGLYDASRRLKTLGIRFGEADSPGPMDSMVSTHMASYIWPNRLSWDGSSRSTLANVISDKAYDVVQAIGYLVAPITAATMLIVDSGASIFFTSLAEETDNKVGSTATWNSASSAGMSVDFEGNYRLFVPDYRRERVLFLNPWCLGAAAMGPVELASVNQLNARGIGFTSPPVTWGREWLPHLFRGDSPAKVLIVHECKIHTNGLPIMQHVHTKDALCLLQTHGFKLECMASGEILDPSVVLPQLFHHAGGPGADLALSTNPALNQTYLSCSEFSDERALAISTCPPSNAKLWRVTGWRAADIRAPS